MPQELPLVPLFSLDEDLAQRYVLLAQLASCLELVVALEYVAEGRFHQHLYDLEVSGEGSQMQRSVTLRPSWKVDVNVNGLFILTFSVLLVDLQNPSQRVHLRVLSGKVNGRPEVLILGIGLSSSSYKMLSDHGGPGCLLRKDLHNLMQRRIALRVDHIGIRSFFQNSHHHPHLTLTHRHVQRRPKQSSTNIHVCSIHKQHVSTLCIPLSNRQTERGQRLLIKQV